MPIQFQRGDATDPTSSGIQVISHVVNTEGGWGAGFVLAVSRRWKAPEREYRKWHQKGQTFNPDGEITNFKLGHIQMVQVEHSVYVCNMLAQKGYGPKGKNQHRSPEDEDSYVPLQYDALEACLTKLADQARLLHATLHMPRIGCALAGGRWSLVEPILQRTLEGLSVTVYDYGPYNP
jgi:O-acetyl-ADP-ribose deacetylase (regulator of RNase III)